LLREVWGNSLMKKALLIIRGKKEAKGGGGRPLMASKKNGREVAGGNCFRRSFSARGVFARFGRRGGRKGCGRRERKAMRVREKKSRRDFAHDKESSRHITKGKRGKGENHHMGACIKMESMHGPRLQKGRGQATDPQKNIGIHVIDKDRLQKIYQGPLGRSKRMSRKRF